MGKRERLAALFDRTGVTSALLASRLRGAPHLSVFSYHRVADPTASYPFDADVVDATPAELDLHVRTIAAHCTPIRIADLVAHVTRGTALPRNAALVTFDDGYLECREVALPILQRHGVPATFFVATRFIEERRLFWWDRIAWAVKRTTRTSMSLERPAPITIDLTSRSSAIEKLTRIIKRTPGIDPDAFVQAVEDGCGVHLAREDEIRAANELLLSWDDVRALRDAGMDVESHTRNHRVIATLDPRAIEDELAWSRDDLRERLGTAPTAIAYPCGRVGESLDVVREAARRTGYSVGFSNSPGPNPPGALDPFAVHRVSLDRGLPASMFRGMLAMPWLEARGASLRVIGITMRLAVLLSLVAPLAVGCASTPTYDFRREPDPRGREYVLGVGDAVRISVWKNAELSTEATIRPDGNVTMPLAGEVVAAGKTPTELKGLVQKKLGEFIHDESAAVTVAVVAVHSYTFTVNGNVEHPGMFSAIPYVTVNDAVSLAGGPNRFASSTLWLIRRDAQGGVRRIPIDYDLVSSGRKPDANLVVLPGDALHIE
jgi:protein involved in polysaccharide export with SLBB domain/peptidoglycan/xylan/chitin deacetylase (PgdA/CDA1 family)